MKTTVKWYAVPPYKSAESWTIVCGKGELIATFENRDECEYVVDIHNSLLTTKPYA